MDRYARQVMFPGIGEAGQQRLRAGRALIVGCGALGTVIANVLARAGVGRLTIVDRDTVEWTNLQRQVLFDEQDARDGTPKAVAAVAALRRVNSDVEYEALVLDFGADDAERLAADADIVLDGTDNFEARYLVNEACVKLGRPWVYAAAVASHGIVMPVIPGETPCLRCVFPEAPVPGTTETCVTAGVLGPAPGVIANLAAAEALKLLVGAHDRVMRGPRWLDCWYDSQTRVELAAPEPDCPTCQGRRFELLDGAYMTPTASLCGQDAVQVRPHAPAALDTAALAARLERLGPVRHTPHLVRFSIPPHELTIFRDGRVIVKGTTDPTVARGIYARYLGG